MYSFIYPIKQRKSVNKVCILVHGLNFNPDSMLRVANEFLKHSFVICFLRLTGHHKNADVSFVELKRVVDKDWLNDLDLAVNAVNANFKKHDLIFCGYSLGGLIGLVYQNQKVTFKKMLLLSPAISTVWYTKLLHLIAFTRYFGFSFSGKIPLKHRVHKKTPMQAYYALSCLLNNFKFCDSDVIVFCHSKDELVSYKGVLKFIKKNSANSWKLISLNCELVIKHLFICNDMYLNKNDWVNFKGSLNLEISKL